MMTPIAAPASSSERRSPRRALAKARIARNFTTNPLRAAIESSAVTATVGDIDIQVVDDASVLALAGAGAVLGLALLNSFVFQPLDMLTLLGFVILIGIVVNKGKV